jgi:hypothetical protein
MSKVIEVKLECVTGQWGHRLYRVTARHGQMGDVVKEHVLYDGHFGGDALKELANAGKSAMAEDIAALTCVSDFNKSINIHPLGVKGS